jgi:trimeric autotransporter adhesin
MIQNAQSHRFWAGVALALGLCSSALLHAQGTAPAVRRITTAVNNDDRVVLNGTIRKNLKAATDLGPADPALPARHVLLVLSRTADRQAALDQYLSDVQNTQSRQYHRWLTPAEYGVRFGASEDDVQTVTAWLQSQGLSVEKMSPANNIISFKGTVAQVQAAFSTKIHSISLNGEKHLAAMSEPRLPRALAPAVKGLLGLDDFHPKPTAHVGPPARFNVAKQRIEPEFTLFDNLGNPYLYVDPSDAATIYDTPNSALNPGYKGTTYDGTGVTVGIVGDSNVDLLPVTNYRLAFLGETANTVNVPTVIVDGPDPGINGDEVETFLDMEVLGGLAPKAKINYYTSDSSDLSGGIFNAMQRAINDDQVSILSISFGECEASNGSATNQFVAEIYEQAAAQGITVTVSSGDSGAAGCDPAGISDATQGLAVNGLGSTPYNISVGGTDYVALASNFNTYAISANSGVAPYWRTALGYIPERPWNDATSSDAALADNSPLLGQGGVAEVVGAGGGKSIVYTKPAYQSALTPADGARDLPDVSFLAANGLYGGLWVLCQSNTIYGPDCATANGTLAPAARFSGVGGTSASTPAFAGMLALVVQATGSRLGQANNVLYKLAANNYTTVFHDVTIGNNSVVCTVGTPDCGANGFTTGYDATAGYDLASGLGSVDVAAMLANWGSAVGVSSDTTLTINGSTSPITVTHGANLSFGVNVNPSSATGSAGLVTTATATAGTPTLNGQPVIIPISNGAGATSYNGLPGGQYTVSATYSGDPNIAASQSAPISINIAPEVSSTLLSESVYTASEVPITTQNAIPYGSYIFSDTTVYGTAEGYAASLGAAEGTMTFFDNGTKIGTAPITSGNFSSFPALAAGVYPYTAGTHKVTATFPGDQSYKSNTSNEVDFTVVQGGTASAIVAAQSTLASNQNEVLQIIVTTSSRAAAPTGTISLSANGNQLDTSSTLQVGSSPTDSTVVSYVNFTLQGTQLQKGQNTLTATYSGDSNYLGSTGTGLITLTQPAFTLTAGSIAIDAGVTTGNTTTISASPSGNFAGVVHLSCSVTKAPSGATNPITCNVPATINVTGVGIATTALTVNSTANTTGGAYTVTIIGTDAASGTVTASATSQVVVTAIPSVTVANSAPISITAGATSGNTSTLTITPFGGFAGAVGISCAVTSTPTGAVDPVACSVAPASITTSGTTASTAVLTVSSTARATGALDKTRDLLGGAGVTSLALGIFFLLPSRRRRFFQGLAALVLLSSLGAIAGCSGAGSGTTSRGTSSQTGTTAGTYVVTVTAIPTGASPQTVAVNVTVN